MILKAMILNSAGERFVWEAMQSEFTQVNSFDRVVPNTAMNRFLTECRYRRDRAVLFSGSEQPFLVRPESTMRKVFQNLLPSRYLNTPGDSRLTLSLAGGEAEHRQLVVIPRGDAPGNCRVEFVPAGDFAGVKVKFEQLGYVVANRKAYQQLQSETPLYPDPLLPLADGRISLAGHNQPVWMTVTAESGARPGVRTGEVRFLSDDGAAVAVLPVSITVRGFSLPERSRFRTSFFLNREFMIDYFDLRDDWEAEKAVSRKIIQVSAEHRLTLMPMLEHKPNWLRPLWTATVDEQGDYHFDFTRENELTRMILDEFHGTGYNVSPSPTWDQYFGYLWVTDPATGRDRRLNYSLNSPEFEKIYRQFLTAAWENARRNHWTPYAYHYIWDEWHGDAWNRLHRLSRQFVPELKNLAVGYNLKSMDEEVRNAVDIWVPLSSAYNPEFAASRVARGDESWSYVCVSPKNRYNLFVDHEAFSHRALLWWCRQEKLDGLLYWGVCVWPRAIREKQAGRVWPDAVWEANQFPDANGDGYLLYPILGSREVYGSLRLDVLRDGLEDMEYFLILADAVRRAEAGSAAADRDWLVRARALEARIPEVIAGEADGSAADYNGELLEEVRNELGALIEEFYRLHPETEVRP